MYWKEQAAFEERTYFEGSKNQDAQARCRTTLTEKVLGSSAVAQRPRWGKILCSSGRCRMAAAAPANASVGRLKAATWAVKALEDTGCI